MKRQLERRKRQREHVDGALQNLISLIRSNLQLQGGESINPSHLQTFFSQFNATSDQHSLQHDALTALCAKSLCTIEDLLRIAHSVPRSTSTSESIQVAELAFAVLKVEGPVDVRERRMVTSVGAVDESSSPLIPFYKLRLPWTGPEQWECFLQSLATPLPMTLRVHRSEKSLSRMADYFLSIPAVSDHIAPVPCLAASMKAQSTAGNSNPTAMYGCDHQTYHSQPVAEHWARTLHSSSCVSFQEVVSALPPAVLGLMPNHKVLDMCAAPGSKSLQALDAIVQCNWKGITDSVVWLNEKDRTKATQTLPARLKRYHAPNIIITRCDGTQLPRQYLLPTGANEDSKGLDRFRFDRIICDVPCSGDGTIRKERSVLSSWSPQYVTSLVTTQRALLRRAIDMLAVGGIVAYSTCSMNPAEDEEVVADALTTYKGCCELIDVNEAVAAAGFGDLKSHGGLPLADPTVVEADGSHTVRHFDASKVLRVLPHRNDTGGFFVAAIRKTCDPSFTQPTVVPSKLNQWMNNKRWALVDTNRDEHWMNITKFFGIINEKEFLQYLRPVFNVNPNGGPQRRIVLVTPAVEEVIFRSKPFKGPGLELVAIGARAFELYDGKYVADAPCRWRAVAECASWIASYATRRCVTFDVDLQSAILLPLLKHGYVEISQELSAEFFSLPIWRTPSGDLETGCVLIGVTGGPATLSGDSTWWLSATINKRKLELAMDESLRNFALLGFYNVSGPTRSGALSIDDEAAEDLPIAHAENAETFKAE